MIGGVVVTDIFVVDVVIVFADDVEVVASDFVVVVVVVVVVKGVVFLCSLFSYIEAYYTVK